MPRFIPSEDSAFIRWRLPGRCLPSLFFAGIAFAGLLGVFIERSAIGLWTSFKPPPCKFSTRRGTHDCPAEYCSAHLESEPLVVPISQELLQGRQLGSIRVTIPIITIAVVAVLWGALHVFMGRSKMAKPFGRLPPTQKPPSSWAWTPKPAALNFPYRIGSYRLGSSAADHGLRHGYDDGLGVALLDLSPPHRAGWDSRE